MFGIERLIQTALEEDIGLGDLTTEATIERDAQARAELVAKDDFILAGNDVAARVFSVLDPHVAYEQMIEDGLHVKKGEVIAWLKGPAHSLLKGERVALNLLQRMSGIATLTSWFVQAVDGTGVRIVDTRKTVPGLRALDKYAVRMGGGHNHRIGLFDGVLIKENHVAAAGGIITAVQRARERAPHLTKIEVETRNSQEIAEALEAGADVIMLDNMGPEELKAAVAQIDGRAVAEASGGVSLETVRELAETGVDLISVGALTHSVPAADVSLLFSGV